MVLCENELQNRSLATLNEDFCNEVLTQKQIFQFNILT